MKRTKRDGPTPEERSGSWGRPEEDAESGLPPEVRHLLDKYYSPACELDWTMKVIDGDWWLVCRLWVTRDAFTVVASKIVYESDTVEMEARR